MLQEERDFSQLAQEILSIVGDADVQEIEDWLAYGDLDDSTTPEQYAEEWRQYQKDAKNA